VTGRAGSTPPLVSVVTAALNAAAFLEQTIRSVLDQDYPRLEYIVMDGGSTDGSRQILERYGTQLHFVSQPDNGQSDAINRGFSLAKGEILAFLNADDTYLPGAITAAVEAFNRHPDVGVVYGNGMYVEEGGGHISPYPVEPFDRGNLAYRCFICQPAAFFRREALLAIGGLDPDLRFALDYDLWIRMAQRYSMIKIDQPLATLRMHARTKTMSEMAPAMLETIGMLRRHYGYVPFNWLYGYAHHRLTGEPVAIEKPRASLVSAGYSLVLGAGLNWRHPFRYCGDVIATARQALT
jgi:hypothetical protein